MKGHDWAFIGSYVSSTLFPGDRSFWCACRNCGRGRDFYIEPNAPLKLPKKYEDAYPLFDDLERMSKEGYRILWGGSFFYTFDQFGSGSGKRNPYASHRDHWCGEGDYKRLLQGDLYDEELCPAKNLIGKIQSWWRKQ